MNEKEFINARILQITSSGIKNFPSDFISPGYKYSELKLPSKTLIIGEEFFGQYEIITPDGNSILHAKNHTQAKYILYSNRKLPAFINIPDDDSLLKDAVQKYESYLDSLIKETENIYKKSFPEEKNSKAVVSEIFKQLNLVRY